MDQQTLWIVPDRLGDLWPGLQALAAALTVLLLVFVVLPRTARDCQGAALFLMIPCCLAVAWAALGNSGLKQWGDQALQWVLLLYMVCHAWRQHRRP